MIGPYCHVDSMQTCGLPLPSSDVAILRKEKQESSQGLLNSTMIAQKAFNSLMNQKMMLLFKSQDFKIYPCLLSASAFACLCLWDVGSLWVLPAHLSHVSHHQNVRWIFFVPCLTLRSQQYWNKQGARTPQRNQ